MKFAATIALFATSANAFNSVKLFGGKAATKEAAQTVSL